MPSFPVVLGCSWRGAAGAGTDVDVIGAGGGVVRVDVCKGRAERWQALGSGSARCGHGLSHQAAGVCARARGRDW